MGCWSCTGASWTLLAASLEGELRQAAGGALLEHRTGRGAGSCFSSTAQATACWGLAVPAGSPEAVLSRAVLQGGDAPWSGLQTLLWEAGFVWDVFFEDGLLKMNNSLGFAQALTLGSK